jgi:hypothetical protein
MLAKISDLAARVLVEGWYATEPGFTKEDAKAHLDPPREGDEFDLDCCLLLRKADGWYVRPYEKDPWGILPRNL